MFNNFRKQLAKMISPVKNAMSISKQFLRYGGKGMSANWSEVMISDEDMYTGYLYAAIRNRAVSVARVASENLKTESDIDGFEHPYYKLIYDSPFFSEFFFWYAISTYLDLEGANYLFVLRAKDASRYGNIQSLKILNPYNVRRVLDPYTFEVTGYVETRNGMVRELPPEMVIPIHEFNPFDSNKNFAMTDAAKESQFTLRSSGDYTRNVIKNNINAPGILSTDVILEDTEFENFKARVKSHTKGEPLFGNGSGAITWQNMTADLSKSALKEVNEINRDSLLAVAGVSKTILGIEQSGTTRETAKVQKDLNIEGQILPRIQLIIDALNMDYRTRYPKDYEKNKAYFLVDNPQATDHDADKKDAEVKQAQFDLFTSLVAKGYPENKAAKYVKGEITVAELGKPKNPPVVTVDPNIPDANQSDVVPPVGNSVKKKDNLAHQHNALSQPDEAILEKQQSLLKNSVINVEEQIVANAIARVAKKTNQYDSEGELVSKSEKANARTELALVLAGFYTSMFQMRGPTIMRERLIEFAGKLAGGIEAPPSPEGSLDLPVGTPTGSTETLSTFKMTREAKKYIKDISKNVAESHIQTVVDDLFATAREAALEGLSQTDIINRLRQKYTQTVSKTRAETVARTETNRAFTQAQYEADAQFIKENDLGGRAYKRWKTRSDNPCAYCKALEDEGLIPFDENFRDLGDVVKITSDGKPKELHVDFEALGAGNAHTNCSCIYELVIKD